MSIYAIYASAVTFSQGHGEVIQYILPDLCILCPKYLRISSKGWDIRGKSYCGSGRSGKRTENSHPRPGWLNYLQVGYNIFYHFQGMPQERRLFTRIQQEADCSVADSCRLPKVRSGLWAGVGCVPGSKICYLDFVLLLIYFSFISRSGWDKSKTEEGLQMALHAACPIRWVKWNQWIGQASILHHIHILVKLDMSMAHWHMKSLRSLSGISAHPTMVTLGNIKVMNAWLVSFSFHVNLCYLCLSRDLQSRSWRGHPVHFTRPMYSLSQISKN